MKITVEMTPEEYDLFRGYQKEKASLERELSTDYQKLHEKHEKLCSTVLLAMETDTRTLYADGEPTEITEIATIKDHEPAVLAIRLAAEWYS